jgi:hypothetical protein
MDLSEWGMQGDTARAKPSEPLDPNHLVAQLGGEVARVLSSALERVTTLATTGRIDRASLRALRDEVDRARRAAIMGQQASRIASGRVRLARERIDLTALLLEALRQRRREIESRGIEVRQLFAPAEVRSDSTLLFALLQTLLDWSFEHAISRIELKLDIKTWPSNARLACTFAWRAADEIETAANPLEGEVVAAAQVETMSWCLLQQTAAALGLSVQRKDSASRSTLTIEFPETLAPRLDAAVAVELEDPSQRSLNSQPLAGRHALVLAARREVRNTVREALRPMGLMIDFVASVEEAAEFCRDGLPHAIVYEAAIAGERFERLRSELLAELPALAFVQIAEHGKAFEVLNQGGRQFASVGRDAIIDSLPAAMLFELSRQS